MSECHNDGMLECQNVRMSKVCLKIKSLTAAIFSTLRVKMNKGETFLDNCHVTPTFVTYLQNYIQMKLISIHLFVTNLFHDKYNLYPHSSDITGLLTEKTNVS